MTFEITRDDEFYSFLKAHLPADYSITAEPLPGYFTEWQYCYRLSRKNELIKEYRGDFREIQPGELIREAQYILRQINENREW